MKEAAEMSKRDEALIGVLLQDPKADLDALAKATVVVDGVKEKIPYATVQKRIRKLTDSGVLARVMTVDMARFGFGLRYRVNIVVNPSELRDKARKDGVASQEALCKYIREGLARKPEFASRIWVEDVFIVLGGEYDMSVELWARDHAVVKDFVVSGLRMEPGISDTMTVQLAWSCSTGDC